VAAQHLKQLLSDAATPQPIPTPKTKPPGPPSHLHGMDVCGRPPLQLPSRLASGPTGERKDAEMRGVWSRCDCTGRVLLVPAQPPHCSTRPLLHPVPLRSSKRPSTATVPQRVDGDQRGPLCGVNRLRVWGGAAAGDLPSRRNLVSSCPTRPDPA